MPRATGERMSRAPRDTGSHGRATTAWPLVGRDGELGVLRRSLDEGAAGVVISGELGVGKSRLAAAFRDALVAEGWASSLHVASEARQAIPFSAFTALLDDTGDVRNSLQRLLDGAARLDSGSAPVLLHVEDGQWLDDESLAFVQQVAESTSATVLLTVRSGHHDAGRVLTLARALGLARLEVQPLSRREVADLLAALVPGLSRAEAHRLWELTGGNPLYLHELVTRSLELGGTVQTDEGLVLAAVDHTGLADVVGGRLDELEAGQLEVLELLAVAPGAPLDLLYRCAGTEGVVDLQRRKLVEVTESGHRLIATLGHPIYAEVVTARMGVATQRLRRRQVLAEVDGHGSRRGSDLVQSALWATEQGDSVDPQLLLAVARRLSGFGSDLEEGAQAAALSMRGLQASSLRLGSAARLAKAAMGAGGGFEAAETWFKSEAHIDPVSRATAEALAAMHETAETEEEHTRAALTTTGLEMLLGRTAPGESLGDLDALRRSMTSAAAVRAVDARRVMFIMMQGDDQAVVDLGREVLADPATTRPDRLFLGASLVGCLLKVGSTEEAVATSGQLIDELEVDDDQSDLGTLLVSRILALICIGRGDEAEALAGQLIAVSEATGNDAGVALFGLTNAQRAIHEGLPEDALAMASMAIHALVQKEQSTKLDLYGPAHAAAAWGHALLGHRDEAAASLARMVQVPQENIIFPAFSVQATAWVAELEGRRRSAVAALRAGVEQSIGGLPAQMMYLRDLLRLGERGCGAEMRAFLDAGADGALWEAFAAHAEAFDADDGAGLDAASVELERLGHVLAAAEAAAQAATWHGTAGDRAAAVASRERSRALAERCQGAQTPALAVKASALRDLAPRELEVARLAGRGASNKEIADELGISVRTVETYLYRIFFKLGVESRAELTSHPEL